MDNYFKDVTPETTPRTASGEYDLESPLCLDMDLLNQHFSALSAGESIPIPRFDFVHQKRNIRMNNILKLEENGIVIFEGIHALNDAITSVHP